MDWVKVRSVIVGSLRNSLTLVVKHGVVYRSNLFKNCIGYTIFRLKCGQEGLMPLVCWLLAFFFRHVVLAQA